MKKHIGRIGTKLVVYAFVLSMALCITAIPTLANPSPVVSVSPASQSVDPGDSFSIDIIVDPDGEWISGGQLYFAFDASVMQVDSVTAGDLFGANYNEVGPFIDNVAGTVEHAIARQGLTTEPTPTGTYTTITLTVNGDAPGGTYALDITDMGLLDENFAEIAGIVINDGEVVVSGEDETPPEISNVASLDITENSATITWTTDENSNSLVKYGTASGDYTMQEYDDADVSAHSIALAGLAADTTYYYVVNSTDPSGNSAESAEHSFTTESVRRGGGGGAPRDSDGDGYTDIQEMLAGTDKDDPCDPDPECAACLALKPAATPTPTPTPTAKPTTTPVPTPEPTAEPAAEPTPTDEPGFEAVFAIAGLLAVAYLALRRKKR